MREGKIAWPEPPGFNAAALTAEERRLYRSGEWASARAAATRGDGIGEGAAGAAPADADPDER